MDQKNSKPVLPESILNELTEKISFVIEEFGKHHDPKLTVSELVTKYDEVLSKVIYEDEVYLLIRHFLSLVNDIINNKPNCDLLRIDFIEIEKIRLILKKCVFFRLIRVLYPICIPLN